MVVSLQKSSENILMISLMVALLSILYSKFCNEKDMVPGGKHFWQERKCQLASKTLHIREHDDLAGLKTPLSQQQGTIKLFQVNST